MSACNAGYTRDSGKAPGGGNGNPLQYSFLGNPVGRGTWRSTVYGAAKSQAQLSESVHLWLHIGIEWETQVLWNKLLGRCSSTKILEKKWEWCISRCFITKLFNVRSHLEITRACKIDFFWYLFLNEQLESQIYEVICPHSSIVEEFFLTYVFRV